MTKKQRLVIGIDTGGTFTDFVVVQEGGLRIHKEPSTPENPARAVLAGLEQLLDGHSADIVHGSTVATNALLERRGARTALITTAGFEDVLEIGRQTRSAIYDLDVRKAPPLVPADRRIGVKERIGPHGEVIRPLSGEEVRATAQRIRALGVESVAICLLHSYANRAHEKQLEEALAREIDAFVTASHVVLPEFREYERCSTTVVNAYAGPVMHRYLSSLAAELDPDRVRIMQSNGGIMSLAVARHHAVQTILSGPAGGAVGGFEVGRRASYRDVITFDMGGTSTDVSLCSGGLGHTAEAVIGEAPIKVPVIDIHTVGAGGGSIAYRDPGGSLRVGPRSAGAHPGPVCYGRGGRELTVTDANLALGRLSAEHFLGGGQTLATELVTERLDRFAREMSLSPVAAAEGIIRVANATMERAIRVISLERGYDPRDFALVCFGGAGAMHAADLARGLGIPWVIVPQAAGTLSALGMLLADFVRDYSQTVMLPVSGTAPKDLGAAFLRLEERAGHEFAAEGFTENEVAIERALDMRYVGQGYELSVPMSESFAQAFHETHTRRYGYADPARPTEIVNVRIRAAARTEKPKLPEREPGPEDASHAVIGERSIVFDGKPHDSCLVDRAKLAPGNSLAGPALIVEYSTTTVVPPDFRCTVDRWENLVLAPRESG